MKASRKAGASASRPFTTTKIAHCVRPTCVKVACCRMPWRRGRSGARPFSTSATAAATSARPRASRRAMSCSTARAGSGACSGGLSAKVVCPDPRMGRRLWRRSTPSRQAYGLGEMERMFCERLRTFCRDRFGHQRPPKGQHHHREASFSKSGICPKRGLDEANHMSRRAGYFGVLYACDWPHLDHVSGRFTILRNLTLNVDVDVLAGSISFTKIL
mmetsp:Transcript_153030/g.489042  ORF Transcript_153030/g.489042 Transcript_153030/m.489042 type:complete len:216 (-) Transcript_153030:1110-1757(-)